MDERNRSESTEDKDNKRSIRTLNLCSCNGSKRCPVLDLADDGALVIEDVEQTAPGRVKIAPEDVEKVAAWLRANGY